MTWTTPKGCNTSLSEWYMPCVAYVFVRCLCSICMTGRTWKPLQYVQVIVTARSKLSFRHEETHALETCSPLFTHKLPTASSNKIALQKNTPKKNARASPSLLHLQNVDELEGFKLKTVGCVYEKQHLKFLQPVGDNSKHADTSVSAATSETVIHVITSIYRDQPPCWNSPPGSMSHVFPPSGAPNQQSWPNPTWPTSPEAQPRPLRNTPWSSRRQERIGKASGQRSLWALDDG